MMHRLKKLLCSGGQGYFNEKGPVNVRVDALFGHPMAAGEGQPSPWFCPSGGNPYLIALRRVARDSGGIPRGCQ
jgi:hypothetical protein